MQDLIPFYPTPTTYFDAQSELKITAFMQRKLKSTLPLLKKLGKEKYSLYGVTKKQLGFLLKDELLKALMQLEPAEKLYLSENLFIYHYKKNKQLEFAIGMVVQAQQKPKSISLEASLNRTPTYDKNRNTRNPD